MYYKHSCGVCLVCMYVCIIWFCNVLIVVTKKPYSNRQQDIWRLECELGVVTDIECPIDGVWAPWSPWSPCHGSCDSIGQRSRVRECTNPPPSRDGIPCNGPEEQTEPCYLRNCTVEDYRKIVYGDIGRIQAFRQLETVPALMERCLLMECPFEAIDAALATDNTWQLNSEALWNSLQCVKHNIGCAVVGRWGAWGSWSGCGARCGTGLRWRLRRCDQPPPSEARLICTGSPLEGLKCTGDQCANDRKSSSGSWGSWEHWTTCSEQCGIGIKRRRRSCLETHAPPASGVWGTHCKGQHDQLEECDNKHCMMDGGWSGWSPWGPCSQTCGAGRQSRTRSCTRPIPSGNGTPCIGSKIEVGSCYLIPCQVKSHTVALFNGDSIMEYNFENKHSALFHSYIRFMALSSHGILVRRNNVHGSVRLSLQNWYICLDATDTSKSCNPPRICSQSIIEPAVWHSVLITVSNEAITLRLDDAPVTMKSSFICDPDLPDVNLNVFIGEKFHGEIQEIILNFIPVKLTIEKHRVKSHNFTPNSASNIAYDKASLEEAYLELQYGQYIRLPCFIKQDEWHLEFTLKYKSQSGTLLFLKNNEETWLLLYVQNMRIKLKLRFRNIFSERTTSVEYLPDRWMDIIIAKQYMRNVIEVIINSCERLHIILKSDSSYQIIHNRQPGKYSTNKLESLLQTYSVEKELNKPIYIVLCPDEYFFGGVPTDVKISVAEEFLPFFGTIAIIKINGILQDLHKFNIERCKDDMIQVSSRTASISSSYHETYWGRSNDLNLSCLYARRSRSLHKAFWLHLDTTVSDNLKENSIHTVDDGILLRLITTANNELRGFYTCRSYANRETHNVVTYGVLGKIKYKLSKPDMTVVLAIITTLTLVVSTLVWLFIEGVHDLREGHGFFRDCHLSPLEEAEAICKYIDQNTNLLCNKRSTQIAKAKARRRGHNLASRSSYAAQEPQDLMEENLVTHQESTSSEPDDLPALAKINKPSDEVIHNIYRCEPNYISSPRHGSITSKRTRISSSSSSSFELTSPRFFCSRPVMTRHLNSLRGNKKTISCSLTSRKVRSDLLTIKSLSYPNQSPARKILQKFEQLKKYDDD